MMDRLQRISEVLYVGLCREIGTPIEVAFRRGVMDMDEIVRRSAVRYTFGGLIFMLSGSYREGFRFKSSDFDFMCWITNHKVISDLSDLNTFNASDLEIILMEHTETPPGFVRLKLLTPTRCISTLLAIVLYRHSRYLSSEKFCHHFFNSLSLMGSNCQIHGPCVNFIYGGGYEFDTGSCFYSPHWPKTAFAWITRCQQRGWPDQTVLREIITNGCHAMAIASKSNSKWSELEWRLSFSQAEKKLVYSLNHTQFICYGILKIFLKEVLSSTNQESLICSYFLKTIMFWEIQCNSDCRLFWCPSNLLCCFWVCFKRLCKCVLDSNCPNFFIPENNMFQYKIIGTSRDVLLSQLIGYYDMGFACLMQSPTLRSILMPALLNLSYVIPFSEGHKVFKCGMLYCMDEELNSLFPYPKSIGSSPLLLKSINNLIQQPLSRFQSSALQYITAETLVDIAFLLASDCSPKTNKTWFRSDKMISNLLKLSSAIGPSSQLLYLGVYFYYKGQYDKVIGITELIEHNYLKQLEVWLRKYILGQEYCFEHVDMKFLSGLMKKAWKNRIKFDHISIFIPELYLVYEENKKRLLIPAQVLLYMLSVLSYHRLGYTFKCLQSLEDLRTFLLYDNKELMAISWRILGICQHVVGDLHGALLSYQESLRQKKFGE